MAEIKNALLQIGSEMAEQAVLTKGAENARKLFEHDTATNAVLHYLAYQDTSYRIMSAQKISDEANADYYLTIHTLKELDKIQLCRFVVGRKGHDSRAEWNYDPISIGQAAVGKTTSLKKLSKSIDEVDDEDFKNQTIEHQFQLRHDYRISIELPKNFNERDAERLKRWLDTLPFD